MCNYGDRAGWESTEVWLQRLCDKLLMEYLPQSRKPLGDASLGFLLHLCGTQVPDHFPIGEPGVTAVLNVVSGIGWEDIYWMSAQTCCSVKKKKGKKVYGLNKFCSKIQKFINLEFLCIVKLWLPFYLCTLQFSNP